jgi:hypothetical protein
MGGIQVHEKVEPTSVPSPKSGYYLGEQSTFLARRADAGISGIFRGGATPPGTSRAGEIVTGLRGRDTRGAEPVAQVAVGVGGHDARERMGKQLFLPTSFSAAQEQPRRLPIPSK